jgi:hypothetical protein
MQPVYDALIQTIIVPSLLALFAALGAWIATRIPGPLRDALKASAAASTSQERVQDVGRLVSAMGRAAAEGARVGDTSTASVVAYAEREAHELISKVGSTVGTLQAMAGAAVQGAAVQSAAIAAVATPLAPLPVVVVDVQPSAIPGAV